MARCRFPFDDNNELDALDLGSSDNQSDDVNEHSRFNLPAARYGESGLVMKLAWKNGTMPQTHKKNRRKNRHKNKPLPSRI